MEHLQRGRLAPEHHTQFGGTGARRRHVLKNDKFATSAAGLHLPLKGYIEEGNSMMLLEENPESFD